VGLQDQQSFVNRALSELTEMQRLAPDHPSTRRCAALMKFLSDRTRDAYLQTLQKLVQEHPDDLQSREDLAKVLLEFRDFQAARAQLNEMLARQSSSAAAHELMASVLIKLLMLDEADGQFKKMIGLYPNREAWLRQWIELCVIRMDYDNAIAIAKRVLSLKGIKGASEREQFYRKLLVQTYRETKRFDEGVKMVSAWLTEPSTDDRYRRLYRSYLLQILNDAKNYDEYLRYCRSWLKEPGENPELKSWLMIGLAKGHKADEAVAMAMEELAAGPEDENKLDMLVEVLLLVHRSDEAIELSKSQLALADKGNDKWRRIGAIMNVYLRARRYDDAAASMKEFIAQSQQLGGEANVFEFEKTLARFYTQAGRYDEAIRYLNGLLTEANSDQRKADLLRLESWAHQRQGQLELAEQRMREALALSPTDVGINNDLGYTLADAGKQLDQAKSMIRLAVSEEPHTAAYLDSYGWVLYKSGEFAEARVWLQRATNMETGDDPVLYDHFGDTLWRLDDKDAALKIWKRSLELNDEKVAEGDEPAEKEVPVRVKAKIKAVAEGKEPAVAPLPPASKPAP
jgi:tetratricopeptide (TPR) repeat protein